MHIFNTSFTTILKGISKTESVYTEQQSEIHIFNNYTKYLIINIFMLVNRLVVH